MALIDAQFMTEVGLGEMPEAEKTAFMEHANTELELRVGRNLSALLTEAQLNEFDRLSATGEAAPWLEQNVPNFREIVAQTFADFKSEIAQDSASYLA